ncbi:MAG: hypothetical protein KIT31_40155 [Deltaproteobacteria bacterium]|nr:hypothetical protein [Deltaproteobacteria bacterium]
MRHPGLLAFGITTCVLVPAAVHHLTASPQQVARLTAPGASSLEIDGTKIDVSVDRAIIDAGDKVRVKLRGALPASKVATVEVLVMESRGSDGGRVETPPRTLERASVTLTGKAGEKEVAFTLPGYRGVGMEGRADYGHYTIFVVPPRTADRLEKMMVKARKEFAGMAGDFTWSNALYQIGRRPEPDEADAEPSEPSEQDLEIAKIVGKREETARLDVQTRPRDGTVAVTVPESVKVGETFAVKVQVKNPTRVKLPVSVGLGVPTNLMGDYLGLKGEDIELDLASISVELGPYATKEVTFKVRANAVGTLGLYAHAGCENDGDNWEACQKLGDGQLEATGVKAVDEAPATVATAAKAR